MTKCKKFVCFAALLVFMVAGFITVALSAKATSGALTGNDKTETSITDKYNDPTDKIIFDGSAAPKVFAQENYHWGSQGSTLSDEKPLGKTAGKSYRFTTYYNSRVGAKLPATVDITGKDAISMYIKFDGISAASLGANKTTSDAYESQFVLMNSDNMTLTEPTLIGDIGKINAFSDTRIAYQFDTADSRKDNVKWQDLSCGWKRVIFPIGNKADARKTLNNDGATPDRAFAQYPLPDLTKIDYFGFGLQGGGEADPYSVYMYEIKAIVWDEAEFGDKGGANTVNIYDVADKRDDITLIDGGTVNGGATKWSRPDSGNDCAGSKLSTLKPDGFNQGNSFEFRIKDKAYVGIDLPTAKDISNKSAISFYMYIDGAGAEQLALYNSMETQFSVMSKKEFGGGGNWFSDNRITFGLNNASNEDNGGKLFSDFTGGWKRVTFPFNPIHNVSNVPGYGALNDSGRAYATADAKDIDFIGLTFMSNTLEVNALKNFSVYIYNVVATDWDYSVSGAKNIAGAVKVENVAKTNDTSATVLDGNVKDGEVWSRAFENLNEGGKSDLVPAGAAEGSKSYKFDVSGTQIMGVKLAEPINIAHIANKGDMAISFNIYISDLTSLKRDFNASETQFMLTSGGNDELYDVDSRISYRLNFNKLKEGWNKVVFRANHCGNLTFFANGENRDYAEQANYNFDYYNVNYVGISLRTVGDESLGTDYLPVSIRIADVKAESCAAYPELIALDSSKNLVNYAIYTNTPIVKYTVTFKNGDTVVETKSVSEGEGLAAANFPAIPAKEGYSGAWNVTLDITNILENKIVTAVYTVNQYYVTVTGGGGAGSFDYNQTVIITPESGKTVKSVKANDGDVTVTKNANGTYSFTMPAKAVSVVIEYEAADGNGNNAGNNDGDNKGCGGCATISLGGNSGGLGGKGDGLTGMVSAIAMISVVTLLVILMIKRKASN